MARMSTDKNIRVIRVSDRPLLKPPGNSRFIQIVGRHLHFHAIANRQANPSLAHLAANRRQHEVLVVEFYPEHCSRQDGLHAPFHFDVIFFHRLSCIPNPVLNEGALGQDRQIPRQPGK